MVATNVEWQLFERVAYVDAVDEALRAGRSVVLEGEAGIGKTTLATQAAPDELVWLQGLEGLAAVSLAPFSLVSSDQPLDTVARAYAWLRAQAEAGVVLVADDVHWFDPVSRGLLAQAIDHDRIRTLATVRPGHGLGEDLVRALRGATWIVLEPLDASMVELALELVLGQPPEPVLVEALHASSGGNPLFLRELVLEAAANGTLRPTADAGWTMVAEPTPPASLVDLVTAWMERSDPEVRRAVELVTVAGHVSLGALETRVDGTDIARGIALHLLRESDGEIYLAHPLLSDVVTRSLSDVRRRVLLRELVEVTAETRDPVAALRRLDWQLSLGEPVTPEDLEAGYRAAVRASNLALAGRIGRAAHDQLPTVTNGLRVANDLHRDGQHGEATALVVALRAQASTPDDVARVASHLLRTQGRLGAVIGTQPDGGPLDPDVVAWADAQLEGSPIATMQSAIDRYLDGAPAAIDLLTPLLEHPVELVRLDAHELLLWASFLAADRPSEYEHAVALVDVNDPYLDDRPQIGHALMALVTTARESGRLRDAYERVRRVYTSIDDAEPTTIHGVARAHAAVCAHRGRVNEGLDAARIARSVGDSAEWSAAGALHSEGGLLTLGGERDEADRLLTEAFEMLGEATDLVGLTWRAIVEALLWFHRAVYQSDPGAVAELRRIAAAELDSTGTLHALLFLARLDEADETTIERLRTVGCHDRYALAVADVAVGSAARDPGALLVAAETLDDIGTPVVAAEAVVKAAKLYRERGDIGSARQCEQRHAALVADCAGLRWPLAALGVDAPELTDRERQIARLVALGWSNRQVADELVLSVRTVENNLHRVYSKLGINRRTELASVLGLVAA